MKSDDEIMSAPLAVEAIGVWDDLERAMRGTNGYGGDVAEIYAFRLVPPWLRSPSQGAISEEDQAVVAGRNFTDLLRRFTDLHPGVEIGIETDPREFRVLDPCTESLPPFGHRVHVRVSHAKQLQHAFAFDLRALWSRAHDHDLPESDVTRWSEATTVLLRALGMEWDADRGTYIFRKTR